MIILSDDDFDFLCRMAERGIYAHLHGPMTIEGITKTSNRLENIKEIKNDKTEKTDKTTKNELLEELEKWKERINDIE